MLSRGSFLKFISVIPFLKSKKIFAKPALSKKISMKKNVAILIFNDAEVLDFAGPFEVFSVASQINDADLFKVFTVSKSKEAITAVNGLSVNPDYAITYHPPIDILVIAGGQGTRQLMEDEAVLTWIKAIYQKSELTLSICSAARFFAKLGLLTDKPFCTHHGVYNHILEMAPAAQPQFEKRFVQTTSRLYTSGGISAGIDLSFHIVEKLFGKEVAENTAHYMEYNLLVKAC